VACAALVFVSLIPGRASAHGSGGAQLPAQVPAVTDEGARAKALLAELAAATRPAAAPVAPVDAPSGDAPPRDAPPRDAPPRDAPPREGDAVAAPSDVTRSMSSAQKALARAHGAHLAGDAAGVRRLSKVALAWAEAARAQLGAAEAERASAAVERQALDLATRRDRAGAMLVEAQARKGQLGAQIVQKEKAIDAAKAPPAAVTRKDVGPRAAVPGATPAAKTAAPPPPRRNAPPTSNKPAPLPAGAPQ